MTARPTVSNATKRDLSVWHSNDSTGMAGPNCSPWTWAFQRPPSPIVHTRTIVLIVADASQRHGGRSLPASNDAFSERGALWAPWRSADATPRASPQAKLESARTRIRRDRRMNLNEQDLAVLPNAGGGEQRSNRPLEPAPWARSMWFLCGRTSESDPVR